MEAQAEPARRPRLRLTGLLALLPCMTALAGCAGSDGPWLVGSLPSYANPTDAPSNVVERALSGCSKRTPAQETECVKKGLADSKVSVAQLINMLPKCHPGQLCEYRYTTHDRLGFIKAYAADLAIHWKVGFDLRHAGPAAADLPITVAVISS